jgi:YesN/AraC family two-component response regulator
LIVDDHEGTRASYSTLLRLAGFETETAATGETGVACARARPFDVILVDLRLPDVSGIEVIRQIKLSGASGRMVIVTAFPALDTSFDAAAAGADGYLEGPLFGDEVVEMVQQAIDGPLPVRHPGNRPELDHTYEVRRPPASTTDPRIHEMMRVIDRDVASPSSVSDLAARVDLGESRLRHLFRSSTGISVTAYRRERRLQETVRRLVATSDDVRQIAYAVGFTSRSLRDFRRAFQNRFGMSPTEYRKRFGRWRT